MKRKSHPSHPYTGITDRQRFSLLARGRGGLNGEFGRISLSLSYDLLLICRSMCLMVTVAVPAADVKQDNNHLDKVNASSLRKHTEYYVSQNQIPTSVFGSLGCVPSGEWSADHSGPHPQMLFIKQFRLSIHSNSPDPRYDRWGPVRIRCCSAAPYAHHPTSLQVTDPETL